MRALLSVVVVALVAGQAAAQVRCKMPNGVWIEQKLSSSCPAGAEQAQTLDGRPLPLKLPEAPKHEQPQPVPAPSVLPKAQSDALPSTRRPMAFDACVALMTRTVLAVGGRNTRVVLSADDVRVLRVCTEDGSVLMTCSRLDAAMVTTQSPQFCD